MSNPVASIADAQDFDTDLGETLVGEAELVGDRFGDIQHPAPNVGPAIVHADFSGFAILEIRYADVAREREGFVGSAAGPWPELFADGGFAREDQKVLAVVRGDAGFDMAHGLAGTHGVVAHAAKGVGLVFVAVVVGGASAEQERGKDQDGEGGFRHGASIWIAVRRVEGMRPQ